MKKNNFIFLIVFIILLNFNSICWCSDSPVTMNGFASADTYFNSSYLPANAADGHVETNWQTLNVVMPHYWQYNFPSPVYLTSVKFYQLMYQAGPLYGIKAFQFLGSSDGVIWYSLYSGTASNTSTYTFNLAGDECYSFYKMIIISTYSTTYPKDTGIAEIIFYENGIMGGMSPDEYAFTVGLLGAVCGLVFCIGMKI
jgi:hypothetical protein